MFKYEHIEYSMSNLGIEKKCRKEITLKIDTEVCF